MQEQLIATSDDLKALNRFTLKELTEEDVFIFSAKFIDDEPTANGRVWSREWMEAAIERKLFEGVSFLTNHDNDMAMKIGTVFSAELREDGIHGKVFIPQDDQGKQAKEAVENGRIRSVSINADGKMQKSDDITRILPSDDMRVYEVSAVAVGGSRSAVITEKSPGGTCESQTPPESNQEPLLRQFATEQLAELQGEFVRLAGFTLGTSNRELYKKVAESLDPLTLKAVANDLRKTYAESQKENPTLEVKDGSIEEIKKSLQNIHKVKGT